METAGLFLEAMLPVLALLIGALIPALLLSRIFLWLLPKRLVGGYLRPILANAASLAGCIILGGFGTADGGGFAGAQAFTTYLLPQMLWLAFDLWRYRRRKSEVIQPATLGGDPL